MTIGENLITTGTITCDSTINARLFILSDTSNSKERIISNDTGYKTINIENNFWTTNGGVIDSTNLGLMYRIDASNIYYPFQWWYRAANSTTNILLAYLNTSSSGLITTSDRNLKNTIIEVNQGKSLSRILNTNIVSYFYNHASDDDVKQGKKSIGVIAQDLQTNNPHCVLEHKNLDDTTNLGVSYNDIFLHNINATKELHKIISEQKVEIDSLKNRLQIAEDNIALLHSTLSQIIGIVNNLSK
jgi:hypothetical protein